MNQRKSRRARIRCAAALVTLMLTGCGGHQATAHRTAAPRCHIIASTDAQWADLVRQFGTLDYQRPYVIAASSGTIIGYSPEEDAPIYNLPTCY